MNAYKYINSKYFNLSELVATYKKDVNDVISILQKYLFSENDTVDNINIENPTLDDTRKAVFVLKNEYYCKKKFYNMLLLLLDREKQKLLNQHIKNIHFLKQDKQLYENAEKLYNENINKLKEQKLHYLHLQKCDVLNTYSLVFDKEEKFVTKIKNTQKSQYFQL